MLNIRAIIAVAVPAVAAVLGLLWYRRKRKDPSDVDDAPKVEEIVKNEDTLLMSEVARENSEPHKIHSDIKNISLEESVNTSREETEACEDIIAPVAVAPSLTEPKADLNSNSEVSVSKVLDIEHSEPNVTEFRAVLQVRHDTPNTSSSGNHDVVSDDHSSAAQCSVNESACDNSPVFGNEVTAENEKLVNGTAHRADEEVKATTLEADTINADDDCSSSQMTDSLEDTMSNSLNLKVNISDCKEEKARSWGSLSSPLEGEVSQFSAQLPESAQTEVAVETVESPTEKLMNSSVASSGSSDANSEGSNDSGKGASLSESGVLSPNGNSDYFVYKFDWPTEMCGRLIGKQHKNINSIMQKTNTKIVVHRKVFDPEHQSCAIEGNKKDVEAALNILKSKFPRSKNPGISFQQTNVPQVERPMVLPEAMQLNLPEGVLLDVVVSSVVDVSHIFVQQPTHPMFPLLERLSQCMMMCYNQDGIVPQLPRPIDVGVICAAPMYNGWYRAQVVHAGTQDNSDECDIKFLDYGGYVRVHASSLRQIRSDFTSLPFQAVECYLANVIPLQGEESTGGEAMAVLEELVQQQLLQANVVGTAEDGVPCIEMYATHKNRPVLINRELVNRGVARWQEVES